MPLYKDSANRLSLVVIILAFLFTGVSLAAYFSWTLISDTGNMGELRIQARYHTNFDFSRGNKLTGAKSFSQILTSSFLLAAYFAGDGFFYLHLSPCKFLTIVFKQMTLSITCQNKCDSVSL